MKVRNGFVSNSSSSSFILRGIRIDEVELCNLLGIEIPEEIKDCKTLYGELDHEFCTKLNPLGFDFRTTANYFGGKPTGEVVIGESLGGLDDGEVTEIGDYEKDSELIEKLKSIGIVDPKPTTFVQMVSSISMDTAYQEFNRKSGAEQQDAKSEQPQAVTLTLEGKLSDEDRIRLMAMPVAKYNAFFVKRHRSLGVPQIECHKCGRLCTTDIPCICQSGI